MSNIYIQEPPTNGKVLLQTTVGDIDIEMWSKEAPLACRNFVQLCLEGYYDGTVFHRVVKSFIVQGGDPTGSGMGGESIYGHPFKDEFHSRLRFVRRGLVAMANAGKDDNGSQFFFTMASCPELQNKHTIFGKVTGNTLYNMLKLEDSLVDQNEKPLYPHKIITTKVLNNPFPDIQIRETKKTEKLETDDKKDRVKGTKNFTLLSFGDEAEEDEEEVDAVAKEFRGKSKSSHDLTNDPHLSSVPAVKMETEGDEDENDELVRKRKREDEILLEKIRKKLAKDEEAKKAPVAPVRDAKEEEHMEKEQKRKEVREEIRKIQRELAGKKKADEAKGDETNSEKTDADNPLLADFQKEVEKYDSVKGDKKKKGSDREQQTMLLLSKFQNKLKTAQESIDPEVNPDPVSKDEENDEGWMTHVLRFGDDAPVLAKDASVKNEDTFEIFDPRNPINQRRRNVHKRESSSKKK